MPAHSCFTLPSEYEAGLGGVPTVTVDPQSTWAGTLCSALFALTWLQPDCTFHKTRNHSDANTEHIRSGITLMPTRSTVYLPF